MIEKKINELEIKFSHQDNLLDQLNKIIMKQQIDIEKLMLDIVEIKLSQSDGQGQNRTLADDVPPHY